jgi:hypothetical protein
MDVVIFSPLLSHLSDSVDMRAAAEINILSDVTPRKEKV